MQEDKQDAERTNVLHQEEIDVEIVRHTQGTVVRKLVVYQFMRHKPADEDTRQETRNGQEDLSCHEIEDVEHRTTQYMQEMSRGT